MVSEYGGDDRFRKGLEEFLLSFADKLETREDQIKLLEVVAKFSPDNQEIKKRIEQLEDDIEADNEYVLARGYFDKGEYEEALKHLDTVLVLRPSDPDAVKMKADIEELQKKAMIMKYGIPAAGALGIIIIIVNYG